MSDRGHIHTLIANREQQLYGSLRDGALSFQKYLLDTITEICGIMNYDFRDLYLKIRFETIADSKGCSTVKCQYCTSQHLSAHTDDKYYKAGKDFTVKNDILDYFYSRIIALEANKKSFTEKKLGAQMFDCKKLSDFVDAPMYEYTMLYYLGGQKITER